MLWGTCIGAYDTVFGRQQLVALTRANNKILSNGDVIASLSIQAALYAHSLLLALASAAMK